MNVWPVPASTRWLPTTRSWGAAAPAVAGAPRQAAAARMQIAMWRTGMTIPGRILQVVDEPNRLARVAVAGVQRTVNVGLLDGTEPGDWVLIHVGFAISQVDEDEAQATLSLLRGMGAEYEQELEELKASAIE